MKLDLKDLGFEPSAELVLLGDEVKLNVIRFSSEKGVYAMVLGGVVKYVGQTKMNFYRRIYGYSNPGPSQQTNIRVNELLRKALRGTPNRKCEVWFIPDARIERGRFKLWLGETTLEGSPDQMILERVLIQALDPEWNRK